MMTKPPGFASSSSFPMDDDEEESIDESLDEILLEANERPLEKSIRSLDALDALPLASDERTPSPSPLGSEIPAPVPLPGMPPAQNDVTVLAPRPSIADEISEESTKVEPLETAIRAAASKDDGLTSQASEQRERALRKSSAAAPRTTARQEADDFEFEDPDAGDDHNRAADDHNGAADLDGGHTPADIPISDEDDDAEPSPLAGFAPSRPAPGGFQPRLPPPGRLTPPPGRPDLYPGRRVLTPNADFLPAPSGGYGGFGSGAHYPSIAIPAPSMGESTTRVNTALTDGRIRLPMGGLAAFLAAAFAGGLVLGALLWRGHAAPAPVAAASAPASPPAAATEPLIKPVAPAAAAAPAKAAAPAAAAEAPAAAAAPVVAATEDAPPVAPRPVRHAAPRPKKPAALAGDVGADAPMPKPKAAAKPKKSAAAWQDPFAQ
jgi:hypothetical protein